MKRSLLLACGIAAPFVYVATDLAAASFYPGYSLGDQAVSELFAIGAPTAGAVRALFTVSSVLLALFAWAVQASTAPGGKLRWAGWFMLANAADSLVLWNFFPMHMRGQVPTFTDAMHGLLAINPFVLLAIIAAAAVMPGWFRRFSLLTAAAMGVTAALAFSKVGPLLAGDPTPGLGTLERASQYGALAWHAVLAIVLLRGQAAAGERRRHARGRLTPRATSPTAPARAPRRPASRP